MIVKAVPEADTQRLNALRDVYKKAEDDYYHEKIRVMKSLSLPDGRFDDNHQFLVVAQ